MKDVLFTLFKGFQQSREDMAQRILQTLEQLQPKTSIAKDMEKVQETIDKLKARREKLLDLNGAGHLSDEDFAGMVKEIGCQLEQQKELLTSLQDKSKKTIDIQKRLQTIQAAFDSFDSLTTPEDITPALVDAVISRIDVTTMGDVIQLDFRLFFLATKGNAW